MAEIERRDDVTGGRRNMDGFSGDGSDCFVRRSELPGIIREAVHQALDSYEHECVMHLKDGDSVYVRDMIGAIKEIGDDSLPRGIAIVRENHKFVHSCQNAATKIGWGVIIVIATIMGSLGMVAVSAWKAQNGGS